MNATTQTHPNEKLAQYMWTAFILMFFVLQAILWTFAISMTAGDKSHTVVAGYDEQALQWDDVRKTQIASERLGWNAKFEIGETADILDNRIVTLELTDQDGQSIKDPILSIRAFHNGRAADVQHLKFQSTGPGTFTSVITMDKAGYWQFEGTAKVDDDTLLVKDKLWLNERN
ncbi:FixH family protein [Mariniblastus fucicola]|uniref:FixH n=1 Tax=Mariniblastus fucicola TaxID=980251 RepID=A0A5B9PBC2_9BACT|nr:FixH family protein [Mariniblastus fucicola]QEG20421.1 FixH [Mariniblastus fucicola]